MKIEKLKRNFLFQITSLLVLSLGLFLLVSNKKSTPISNSKQWELYWFIPDGFRTEPELFNIYRWADQGLLPNIKWMKDNGAFAYSIPNFPGHTPTNIATLVTGSTPNVHGVVDGGLRYPGYPLNVYAQNGFSSLAKKVDPIWYTLENRGKKVAVLSMPGSTPPELKVGITLKGRWGGWGFDFPPVNFHSSKDEELKKQQGLDRLQFSFGTELTRFVDSTNAVDWLIALPKTFSEPYEVQFKDWGTKWYGWVFDSTDDGQINYDRILFSFDKKSEVTQIKLGDWSDWHPIKLNWPTKNSPHLYSPKAMDWENDATSIAVNTQFKVRVIDLHKNSFRIRFLFDALNEFSIQPANLFSDLNKNLGPMVDFVDSYPPQLVFDPKDRNVFIEEANFSTEWHKNLVGYLASHSDSKVVLHNIYTPNQMLTSRWWLPFIDPQSSQYHTVDPTFRQDRLQEVLSMYQKIDAILGEAITRKGSDQYIVFSSDHGAIPLVKEVLLNNLFASKSWLKYRREKNNDLLIDWKNSQVVFLQMNHIYINPKGLSGPFKRAQGEAYQKLRDEVKELVSELNHQGQPLFKKIVMNEKAGELDLISESTGDLILVNSPGFSPVENLTETGELLRDSFKGGYKQGVDGLQTKGLWTPFMIAGPGIKKNFFIEKPILHQDQYPTIMTALKQKIPPFVTGKVLSEIFEKPISK